MFYFLRILNLECKRSFWSRCYFKPRSGRPKRQARASPWIRVGCSQMAQGPPIFWPLSHPCTRPQTHEGSSRHSPAMAFTFSTFCAWPLALFAGSFVSYTPALLGVLPSCFPLLSSGTVLYLPTCYSLFNSSPYILTHMNYLAAVNFLCGFQACGLLYELLVCSVKKQSSIRSFHRWWTPWLHLFWIQVMHLFCYLLLRNHHPLQNLVT